MLLKNQWACVWKLHPMLVWVLFLNLKSIVHLYQILKWAFIGRWIFWWYWLVFFRCHRRFNLSLWFGLKLVYYSRGKRTLPIPFCFLLYFQKIRFWLLFIWFLKRILRKILMLVIWEVWLCELIRIVYLRL